MSQLSGKTAVDWQLKYVGVCLYLPGPGTRGKKIDTRTWSYADTGRIATSGYVVEAPSMPVAVRGGYLKPSRTGGGQSVY